MFADAYVDHLKENHREKHAMFEAATHNVVQACGDDCLHHVPSVFESDDFSPFHIVVKKRRKFFFLNPKLSATPFMLSDLFIENRDADFSSLVETSTLVKDYKKDYKLSLKGHAGSKLKAMFEVELSGKDDIDVEFDLGALRKDSVNIPKFIDAMRGKKVDLNHPFVKQVRQSKRKSLCVVVGSVSLNNDCMIETKADKEGDEKISVDKLKIATLDESTSLSSNRDKRLTLLKGTILAYEINELSIRTTGTVEIIVDEDVKGGFAEDLVDGSRVATPREDAVVADLFSPIVSADRSKRILIRRAVLELCLYPQAFQRFFHILSEARRCVKGNEKLFTTVGKLKTEVDVNFESWLELLKFADFLIEGGKVTYPTKLSEDFEAIYNLLKCLHVDMDDTILVTISQLSNNLAPALVTVLSNASLGREMATSDTAVKLIYDCENAAQRLLAHLGFYFSEGSVCPPTTGAIRVKALYQVVYSLFDCRK